MEMAPPPVNNFFKTSSRKRHFFRAAQRNRENLAPQRNFRKASGGGDVILQSEGFPLCLFDSGFHQVSDGNQPHKAP